MKPNMIKKLATLSDRLEELNRLMSSEGATNNMDNYRKITQEHAKITPIVEQYRLFEQTEADMNEAQKMLSDPDMKEFALEEIEAGKATLEKIESALQKLLLPKDPNDDKNLFLEIRAGTGGDESGLFWRFIPHVFALCRAAKMESGNHVGQRIRGRRLQRNHR